MKAQHAPPRNDAGNPELIARLRAEIERDGPITFARFMERALYEQGLGYYATTHERPTRAGDFLTAPEVHPIFGRAVAAQLTEMSERLGEPGDMVVREYGAGRGALAAAIGPGLRHERVDIETPPGRTPLRGAVLANEFIDALPVHRVVRRGSTLSELLVGWRDGAFVDIEGELSSPALAAWFSDSGVNLADGARAEVNLQMVDWLAEVAATLVRGYVLIIDYGLAAAELYGPTRVKGTLRSFRAQRVSSNVLGGVGRQDITATVDLDALERGARRVGLDVLGRTSQTEFLVGCGFEQLMAQERSRIGEDWQGQLLLRSAAARLLDPRQMGSFAVVILGRDVPAEPPLRGLAYLLPRRG